MKFKDQHEAFNFILELSKKLLKENKIKEGEHLKNCLQAKGAATSTEAMGIMVLGLKDFISNYPTSVDDIERKKIEYAIDAYKKGMGCS
jgi:hypothetical protein